MLLKIKKPIPSSIINYTKHMTGVDDSKNIFQTMNFILGLSNGGYFLI